MPRMSSLAARSTELDRFRVGVARGQPSPSRSWTVPGGCACASGTTIGFSRFLVVSVPPCSLSSFSPLLFPPLNFCLALPHPVTCLSTHPSCWPFRRCSPSAVINLFSLPASCFRPHHDPLLPLQVQRLGKRRSSVLFSFTDILSRIYSAPPGFTVCLGDTR